MDSRTFNVQQIYQDRRQYRVPFYQRAYVWNRGDQWIGLWEDIREKAEARFQGGNKPIPHFMGAVVLEPQKKIGLLGVERHHIIDGQQRLTTMQYVLTALRLSLQTAGYIKLVPLIDACLTNTNPETMEDQAVESFKLWPTFRDRKQYEMAMTADSMETLRERFPASFTQTGSLRRIGIAHPPAVEAIVFFHELMDAWILDPSEMAPEKRAMDLASAVLTDLSVVCISLGEEDDAQVIFETLNGRGAELHATDLIRNFIFMKAGSDADQLYSNLWIQFEDPLWAELQSRGRLNRPRLEWFVQSAVQAQTGDDIDIGRLYAGYRRFVDSTPMLYSANAQLAMLNRYGEHYKALVKGVGGTPVATFGRRIAVWDASATHALAIKIAASDLSIVEQQAIFSYIESYLVRRAVCGLSKKNYNKVFSQQLRKLSDGELTAESFRQGLASFSGEASRWPTDEEFCVQWLEGDAYPGRLDAGKLRAVFHRLETAMRSEFSEEKVPLEMDVLDIDHVLPQSWYKYWPLQDGSYIAAEDAMSAVALGSFHETVDPVLAPVVAREKSLKCLGNLTLIHYGINRSLQNHQFEKKREAFFQNSNLQINRQLMQKTSWTEVDILARGRQLSQLAVEIWPGPSKGA